MSVSVLGAGNLLSVFIWPVLHLYYKHGIERSQANSGLSSNNTGSSSPFLLGASLSSHHSQYS